ncbi:MAG TPA: hypothetical protein VLH94_00650 [Spirochaetia bacterium]|nr:hypothetical protein [Spirochaetia bacterium]
MNLVNLFGNKTKDSEPDYFLAIEIHESLIKTALWEVADGIPSVVNVGSFESWADEDSLINGVDASLEQAVKVIKQEPRKVIFGLPDSWIDGGKIHTSKTKLVSRLVKELGLNPIGMVPINSAIAHYMKKLEGIPPTAILLEIYTTKVVVSIIEKGEITSSEETARSDDLAQDVEEGLTVIGVEKLPSRFILTNGGALEEEEQRITSHPWQERLPFQHMPKVEVLGIDFSIRAIALTGGTEAVQHLTGQIKEEPYNETLSQEETNIYVPDISPPSISELGFSYEESAAPNSVEKLPPEIIEEPIMEPEEPEFAIVREETPLTEKPASKLVISLPKVPQINFPKIQLKKASWLYLLALPLLLVLGYVLYLFTGEATIAIAFNPQKISSQFIIAISESSVSGTPTLLATKKTVIGTAKEQIPTTGEATVGDKATGTISIANKSVAPIIIKAGSTILSDNGKYSYSIPEAITIASKSADVGLTPGAYGIASGVKVTAVKIGADYNLPKNSNFSVDSYSKNTIIAVADADFSGGTSMAVRAVSKADQDKLLQVASDKIKSQIENASQSQTPGSKSLVLSDFAFTKKNFDKTIGEEATNLNLDLEGSIETLVYSEESLFQLTADQLAPQISSGSEIFPGNTSIKLETPIKKEGYYEAKLNVETSVFPKIDEAKLKSFISGKPVTSIRPFFSTIQGFDHLTVRITPKIPIYTNFLPLKNIKFELVGN